ncbi:MAG: ABC transporter substrate-binding protein [Syntrophaceae bacterium]
MQKRSHPSLTILGLIIALLAVLTIAAGPQAQRAITDMLGRRVMVSDPLQRVALLGGPTGQVAYILGVQDRLCAVTASLKSSPLVRGMDPRIRTMPGPRTTAGNINIEALIASDPQLVIAGGIDGEIVLRKTRIPVAFLDDNMGQSFENLKKEIRFYAHVFQTPARAEQYIAYLDMTLALVRSRLSAIPPERRALVFNGYGPAHLVTLGGDTFMQERLAAAGCRNAAEKIGTTGKREGLHTGLGEVSMEQVLGWDPDVLVIDSGTPQAIYADPRWKALRAVRLRRVFRQPSGVFIWDRPTAESAVLYPLWIACTAYPERFKDINLVAEVQRFYREIFGFALSDAQARKVLSGGYADMAYNG